MPDFTAKQVLEKVKKGESLERADLRHIVLSESRLREANFKRADLEGANLEGSNLRRAMLTNVNLRDAYVANADLAGATLQKADLEGANLERADLREADLSRANLEGANLEGAKLDGARLTSSQLELANLGGASMVSVDLAKADLREAYLGGAKLLNANLRFAHLEKVNVEEADLTGCDLTEANLRDAYLERAVMCRTNLDRAILDGATLIDADLSEADLRGASIRHANVKGLKLTGAMLAGLDASPEQLGEVDAEWVRFATHDTEFRVEGEDLVSYYTRMRRGGSFVPAQVAMGGPNRFFGPGDVLRNAALEFGPESVVEIQSRFENCSIALVEGARLTVGAEGVLEGCRIVGPGEIVVSGRICQGNGKPSIVGPRRLIVCHTGSVDGVVEQHPDLTQFAFERGCVMRVNITRHGGMEVGEHV